MGWASAFLAVVLASTIAVLALGWICLLSLLWASRDRFEIAVRCPSLNAIVQIINLVLVMSVLLHWLLLSLDESLPCLVIFWVSQAVVAFGVAPHLIRAARLVVVFNRMYRVKYARFVKSTVTTRVWAATTVALFVRAVIFLPSKPEHYSRNARECFFMDDIVLGVGFAVVVGPPAILLALGLSTVNDAFKIREELIGTIIGGLCSQGVGQGMQILVAFNILPHTPHIHISVEIIVLLFGLNTGIWGLLMPMVRAHRHGLRPWLRGNIAPVENVDAVEAVEGTEGVLVLAAEGGETADMFDAFCRKHLCQESWDFIVDATRYDKMAPSDPDEQYIAFLHILDQYLLPTSPNEVNISCKSRTRVVAFRTRESFSHLDDGERRTVLHGPLGEVVQMLEENLLQKFWSHVAIERAVQLAELAGGDRALMELMSSVSSNASGLKMPGP